MMKKNRQMGWVAKREEEGKEISTGRGTKHFLDSVGVPQVCMGNIEIFDQKLCLQSLKDIFRVACWHLIMWLTED